MLPLEMISRMHATTLALALMILPGPAAAWRLMDVRPVSPPGEFFMAPSWSPGGNALAVTRQKYRGVLIADLWTAGSPSPVTDEPGAGFGFVWSQDGGEILFQRAPNAGSDTRGPRRLMRATLGRRAFEDLGELRLPGISQRIPPPDGPTAYVDAEERVWLLRNGVALLLSGQARGYYAPAVSPTGDRVLAHHRNGHLHVLRTDRAAPDDLGEGYAAVWSPDGAQVLFDVSRDDGHVITSSELFIVSADGGVRERVTNTPDIHEMRPAWCRDGVRIAFDDPASGRVFVGRLVP